MPEDPQILLIILPILLFSIVLHEMAHGYAALFGGDPTAKNMGRLTLNPIVHLDPIWSVAVPAFTLLAGGFFFGMAKPVMYNPQNLRDKKWGEAKVALAGPAVNIAIAIIFAVAFNILASLGGLSTGVMEALYLVVVMNLFLAVLNLIPVPPLDGSKILFAILPRRMMHIRLFLERYALIVIFALLFILISTNILGTIVYALADMMII
ncbi:MAG: site-2 protease family protein [Patescibacteria group bacterium]